MGEDGKPLFDAIPTSDWGDPATLEEWRRVWAEMVNAKFAEKGLECRVDHRSYERQGLDLLPTVHEGVAVRQMEARGITTDKGDFNRWVRKARDLLRGLRKKITDLTDWIKATKDELSKPQTLDLAALLTSYYEGRNAGAWSRNAKIGNLKNFAEAVNYLTEKGITTLEELEAHIAAQSERMEAVNAALKAMSARKKELENLLNYADLYRETKPIYDEWKGIKWKGRREKFGLEHEGDLRTFHMARRKLGKYLSPAANPPVQAWRQELDTLQQKYQTEYRRYKPIQDDLWKLQQVGFAGGFGLDLGHTAKYVIGIVDALPLWIGDGGDGASVPIGDRVDGFAARVGCPGYIVSWNWRENHAEGFGEKADGGDFPQLFL